MGVETIGVNSAQKGDIQSALPGLSRVPENYSILEKGSNLLRKEGKIIGNDVESVPAINLLGSFRNCPRVEPRTEQYSITLPRCRGRFPNTKSKYSHLPDDGLPVLKETSAELVKKGFTVPARTPVAAPVLFVWNKDGSPRLIDYRPNHYKGRLSGAEDTASDQQAGKTRWFTKLDLQRGHYQVETGKEDQQKSASKTRYGTCQFTGVPFGLSGGQRRSNA